MIYYVYTDGASRGNPGHAGIAYIIYNEDKEIIDRFSKYIGKATNNEAEYRALLMAVEKVVQYSPTKVYFYLDSELVVKQLNGEYKVKNKNLMKVYEQIRSYIISFDYKFEHIPRELNKIADKLAKEASYNIM
jgi:ribonuclease HI